MSDRFPEVGKLSIPGKTQALLSELVTEIVDEYSTGQVGELSVTFADTGHLVASSSLAQIGTTVTFAGSGWQVASVEGTAGEWGTLFVLRARDPLARKLRKTYKTNAERKVSPGDWVKARVKAAGGSAVVQPSSKRQTIAQSKNQSVLDVVGTFASELDWSWTSYGGRFYFASRHYAWQRKLGLPHWKFTWGTDENTDALSAEWAQSDDNSENVAELTLSVPYDAGAAVRPWHTFWTNIPGARGFWLVENVTIVRDGVSPVEIQATQPKKPSPKPGSSSKE